VPYLGSNMNGVRDDILARKLEGGIGEVRSATLSQRRETISDESRNVGIGKWRVRSVGGNWIESSTSFK